MKNKISKIMLMASAILIVILISACKESKSPNSHTPATEPTSTTQQPEKIMVVQTNFEMLTPFEPQHSLHTRLHEGALPDFIPSNDYGMLLPYSIATGMEDGSMFTSKYGLVTIYGVIVTDLIYDGIDRAEYIHSWYVDEICDEFPAYRLYIQEHNAETEWDFYSNRKMAACALDGSWVTGFDYTEIAFTEEVILLYRDDSTFDIDVMDYDGNRLYNMLDFDWARETNDDLMTERLIVILSDRDAHVRLKNNTYAFIDLLTGNVRPTRFNSADPFVEGGAPVGVGIPGTYYVTWGLINTDFEVVIQPRYASMPFFKHGKAIVQRSDDSQYVINTKGDVLFDVPDNYFLDHSYDGPTFVIFSKNGADSQVKYLTSEFEEIFLPEGAMINNFGLRYLNNGWFTTGNEDGSYLIRGNDVYYFQDVDYISFFDGELILYVIAQIEVDKTIYKTGVMTLDRKEVITPESDIYITPVMQNGNAIAFIVGTNTTFYSPEQHFNPNKYRLVDIEGKTIIQGSGILTYHESLEMYSVQNENLFSWLDKYANPLITIPFLSSTFD